jgi:hypothetical protein
VFGDVVLLTVPYRALPQTMVLPIWPAPKADIETQPRDVRFVPKADIPHCSEERRLRK